MRRVETSWELIEAVLYEHAHSVYKSLRRPAPDEGVDRLEALLGRRLPADFRRSLGVHDGQRGGRNVDLFDGYALLPISRILAEWRMRSEVHGDDDPGGCPLTTDRRIKNDRWWRPGWVPVLEENGNMVLLDLDPGPGGRVGQVVKFWNSGVSPRRVKAESFAAYWDQLADRLAARRFRLSEFGDIWLDDTESSFG